MQQPVRTAYLLDYLVRAWHEVAQPSTEHDAPAPVLARETTRDEAPVLYSDRANHVLAYVGAFNPPHSGHMQALADGFYNSGPGLSMASALVLPIPDDGIRTKLGAAGPALPAGERAGLIAAHLAGAEELRGLACRTAVLAAPAYALIPACMRLAGRLAAADGFRVEFVSLKGADHLFCDRPIRHPALEVCTRIVVSEGARPRTALRARGGSETGGGGPPGQLVGGWGPWRAVAWRDGGGGGVRTAWEATRPDPEGSAVRFLPGDGAAAAPGVSSTRIREVMLGCDPGLGEEVLVQRLRETHAICPERLAAIVAARPR